jgi:hypothetical protein
MIADQPLMDENGTSRARPRREPYFSKGFYENGGAIATLDGRDFY